jgi:L-cysteine/cystine lyase
MTFEEARAQFPVLERVAYLNAGTFGPLARATVEAQEAQALRELAEGRRGKPYFDELRHCARRCADGWPRSSGPPRRPSR